MSTKISVEKRILSDLKELESSKDELNKLGIFYHMNEDNIHDWMAVIKGTENTPYEESYFLFKIKIPNIANKDKGSYPMVPPHFKFCTRDGITRFNPNLYIDGKVCVSLLNTWNGPSWTPVYTLKTILLTIQAEIMNENPLVNEPGWENASKKEYKRYNTIVQYKSLEIACLNIFNKKYNLGYFSVFYDKIKENITKNYEKILTLIDNLIKKNPSIETIKMPCYSKNIQVDFKSLKHRFLDLNCSSESKNNSSIPIKEESKITNQSTLVNPSIHSNKGTISSDNTQINVQVKKKRYAPSVPAKIYDEGFICKSENDNNADYIVKVRKNGVKYWKKV